MKHSEFGRLVRRSRDRVTPSVVGLPVGGRRRAAGLRREELAGLAGISADYLTRLEQGRATSPSAQAVEALARALRLQDAERDLLYRLAGHATPGLDVVPSRITPSVQRLLDRLASTPVAVHYASETLLVANAPYDALMSETSSWHGLERNAVWRHLVGPGTRVVHTPEERADLQRLLVADLRRTATRYPADPGLRHLVGALTAGSPRFVELWESGDVEPRPQLSRRNTIDHPVVGLITLDCDALVVTADDLRLMVYTAEPNTEDADRLVLALVLGTQTLVKQPTSRARNCRSSSHPCGDVEGPADRLRGKPVPVAAALHTRPPTPGPGCRNTGSGIWTGDRSAGTSGRRNANRV